MEKRTAPERRPYRILVVEDDAAISRVLQLELEHERYEVDVARDGLSGLEKALKEPDLVILDLMLPKLSGYDLCRRVRGEGFHAPILMLSSRSQEGDRVTGLDLGANDYVSKPFSLRELLARVRALLRSEREHRQDAAFLWIKIIARDHSAIEIVATNIDRPSRFARLRI